MPDWLAARARVSPKALALVSASRPFSYAELDALASTGASGLAADIVPGTIVATLLPAGVNYVALVHAVARAGGILMPLNARLTPSELRWQLGSAGCGYLIYARETAVAATALREEGRRLIRDDALLRSDVLARRSEPASFEFDRPQAIIFTSGTTGRPKGAVLTFGNNFWSATASAFLLGVAANDRWLSCLPLYHVGGLAVLWRSCLYGTAVVLHDRFDAEAISEALDREAITLMSLVPTMLTRLLDFRGDRPWPDSLRHLLLGGAAAGPSLFERCAALKVPLATTYGLTEAASQVATLPAPESLQKAGSAGKPLLFTEVTIVAGDGTRLGPGEIGEIIVSGPTVMPGYLEEGGLPRSPAGGPLHTGDVGFVDEDGDLWLVQRRDDIIVSGGENIYPAEVEQVLESHPAVAAACVAGVPDSEWGQRVAAMLQLANHGAAVPADLEGFCRQHLAGYKVPRFWQIVERLPHTGSGKINRQEVSRALAAGLAEQEMAADAQREPL